VRREGRSLPILVITALVSYSLILEILRVVPVSYVVAVRQTSVVFALLLGIFWLRERPGRRRLFGAALTLIGVASIGAA
jgi:drug/metabolite transporter (DMT)-like permease